MKKIDKILKQLSDLYEFNRRIKGYELKKEEKADKQEKAVADRRAPQPGAQELINPTNSYNDSANEKVGIVILSPSKV